MGIDQNVRPNQIKVISKNYEDPNFLGAIDAINNIHPHIILNTCDIVWHTKPIDETF